MSSFRVPGLRQLFSTVALGLMVLGFGAAPALADDLGLVNSATFGPELAPGTYASMFKTLPVNKVTVAPLPLPTMLDGVSIWVGPRLAKLVFVSEKQTNLLLPQLAPGRYTVVVQKDGQELRRGEVTLLDSAPGIFTANDSGKGVPKAQSYNNGAYDLIYDRTTLQSKPVPVTVAGKPNYLIVYGTGKFCNTASFDGVETTEVSSALQGQYEDLWQANIKLSPTLAVTKNRIVNVSLRCGSRSSNWVRVCIQGTSDPSGVCPLPTPARIEAISGTGQATALQYPFPEPLVVRITDSVGNPIEGLSVHWEDSTLTTRINTPDTLTDLEGQARITPYGAYAGNPQSYSKGTITASLFGSSLKPAEFKLTTTYSNSFGIWAPAYRITDETGDTPIALTLKAGTVADPGLLGSFAYSTGVFLGQAASDLGMNVWMERLDESGDVPDIRCETSSGVDTIGTVLTDEKGRLSCKLKVGAIRGRGMLYYKVFGAYRRGIPVTVE